MHILYIDESGDLAPLVPERTHLVQPVFAIGGLLIPQENLAAVTLRFMALKSKYFGIASLPSEKFEAIKQEVKGSNLRSEFRRKGGHARKQLQFMDELLSMLSERNCKVLGSIYVKGVGRPFDGRAVYTTAIQKQVDLLQKFLLENESMGLVIADSRRHHQNSDVTHAIFTQQFSKYAGRDRLIESPVFGNSSNHAGLQIADLITSVLLVPLSLATYCQSLVNNPFNHDNDHMIKLRYASSLKRLQVSAKVAAGRRYGIYVNDGIGGLEASHLFTHTTRPSS